MSTVSVIIPALNAEGRIGHLVRCLMNQRPIPDRVVVIDSSSEDSTAKEARLAGAEVRTIKRSSFNHGLTRHDAILFSGTDFVCFLTDDATPVGDSYLVELLAPFSDPLVAMAYGRQLPRPDARPFERLVREFRYPPKPVVRDAADVPALGIRAFTASDVCSAYRRSAYLTTDGFGPCETNEDMLMAARLMWAGWRVAYAATAEVVHSHNLSPASQFRRNEMLGREMALHASELGGLSADKEGMAMVRFVAKGLVDRRDYPELAAFGVDCAARIAGNRWGRWSERYRAIWQN